VATDPNYLRQLCEASGGRLLDASELSALVKSLAREKTDETPKVLTQPVWDEAWVCYSIAFCFGLDWFLRRRWGLS